MLFDKYSIDGNKTGQIELADSVFSAEINKVLIYEYIKAANANLRQGTHKTKERSDVRGGGIKPWRQKGTGRARQGTIRAPQWRGGGTVFGPRPRSYRIEIPRAMKDEAYRSILTFKAQNGSIKIVDDFSVESGKTKDMAKILKSLNVEKGLLITSSESQMLKRAIRNIDTVKFNNTTRISGRDIFYSNVVLITESAAKQINEKYMKGDK